MKYNDLNEQCEEFLKLANKKDNKAEAAHVYVVDIYESAAGDDFPVVRHQFYGKTRKEAKGYYEAHMKTDKFMKDCVEKKQWKKVKCQSKKYWG